MRKIVIKLLEMMKGAKKKLTHTNTRARTRLREKNSIYLERDLAKIHSLKFQPTIFFVHIRFYYKMISKMIFGINILLFIK